MLNVD